MKRKVYYLNSTHWDREWYLPFQSFRYNLVDMINGLLEIIKNDPEYKLFCFDGQTIVLDDYLEVFPERRAEIAELIKQGRIKIGPWYVMPDEFLLSGESLIRNLATGIKSAKDWGGEPWLYGYVNDIFGHIAQMPQIFAGFGIRGAYIGRGLGNTEFNNFVWTSPDGTECYTTIGDYSYFKRNHIEKFGTDEFKTCLKNWINLLFERSDAPIIFFSNTDDHKKATANTPDILKMIEELFDDVEVVDADLSEMATELAKYRDKLPKVTGELTKPLEYGFAPEANIQVLYHTLSSHYPVKQSNDECQNLLEKKIEPMVAISNIDNNPISHRFVNVAYKYLLQNHPHDSICGCSADQVHKDMVYRFDQAKGIGNRLYEKFVEFAGGCYIPQGSCSDYRLKVYNLKPFASQKICTAQIYFYKDFESTVTGYADKEKHNNFVMCDNNGKEIPYQIVNIKRSVSKRIVTQFQKEAFFDVYTIAFMAKLPAFGMTEYAIHPAVERKVYTDSMKYGKNWAENEFIKLNIESNGELTIFDKRNGSTYSGLHEFSDNGEVGDGWHHESPVNDITITGYGSSSQISCVNAGIAQVTFKIVKTINVPAFLDGTLYNRSEEEKEIRISSLVTVKKDSPAVEITTEINNTCKDHRMKLLLPTGIKGDKYFVGQAFYCAEREVGTDSNTADWIEPESLGKNMNGIIGKRDAVGKGFAFVSAEGLHEAGCDNDESSTIEVTLFRSFDRVFLQTESHRSQVQGVMKFRYALIPLTCDTEYSDLLDLQYDLSESDIKFSRRVENAAEISTDKSYFAFDNKNIALSVFKCAEDGDGYIIRAFNTKPTVEKLTIDFGIQLSKAFETDLNEENVTDLNVANNSVCLEFKPWQIKTLRVKSV